MVTPEQEAEGETRKSKLTGEPGGQPDGGPDDAAGNDRVQEVGGRKGPDPTRYGDWEKDGRCIDF